MSRLEKFEALSSHPWYSKVFNSVKAAERERLRSFITEREGLSPGDFYEAVQRAFPRSTKEDVIGAELLLVVNFAAAPRRRT